MKNIPKAKYNIFYDIGIKKMKTAGYQSKKGTNGVVKINLSNKYFNFEPEIFMFHLVRMLLLETFCLFRGFEKLRMKDRCKPCKMLKYSDVAYNEFLNEYKGF